MRQLRTLSFVLAVLPRAVFGQAPDFHVEALGKDVYAIVRHEPIAYVNNANSLVIVGDDGVIVVDAQFTRRATNETIGAIRAITRKPVRYVVNTHWHDDHVAGNQVYRDTFPGVVFVSHENTRTDLATLGAANRKGTVQGGPAFVVRLRRLLAQGLGVDSTPVVPLERAAMESTIKVGDQYFAEAPGFRETLADTTFSKSLTLHLGARNVELLNLGPANTRGDAIVFVPDAGIVATGDLLVYPVPFAFGSSPDSWRKALDVIDSRPTVAILPGHGPVMRDHTYLRLVRAMLASVVDQVSGAVSAERTLEQARSAITLPAYCKAVAGDDKWLNSMFSNFFLNPSVTRAYEEANGARH